MQTLLQGNPVMLIFPLHHCPKPFSGSMSLPRQVPNLNSGLAELTNRDITNTKLTRWVKRAFGPESSISFLGCFHLTHGCGMFTATDSRNTSYLNPIP